MCDTQGTFFDITNTDNRKRFIYKKTKKKPDVKYEFIVCLYYGGNMRSTTCFHRFNAYTTPTNWTFLKCLGFKVVSYSLNIPDRPV